MQAAEIRGSVLQILATVTPQSALDQLDDERPLRDQLNLDSMDHLDIVIEIRKRHRIDIPEDDYGRLASLNSIAAYVASRLR